MSVAKFTKSEWAVDDYGKNEGARHPGRMEVWAGDVRVVDSTNIFGNDEYQDEIVANMHLIAAAPEMYAELQRDVDRINEISSMFAGIINEPLAAERDRKVKLLAKARGEHND